MSTVRFLCDEHIHPALAEAVRNREPSIEAVFVGDPTAPPSGSTDPELLQFAEQEGYALLTADRSTMPAHVTEHHAAGRHTNGVFLIRRGANWTQLIDDLLAIWSASDADDWRDQLEYLPW